jgi:hypothetical protein
MPSSYTSTYGKGHAPVGMPPHYQKITVHMCQLHIIILLRDGLLRFGRLSGGLNDTTNRPGVGIGRDRDEAVGYPDGIDCGSCL